MQTMTNVTFRVYIDRYCDNCSTIHPFPTDRIIKYMVETASNCVTVAHKKAVRTLNVEGRGRPLYQYHTERDTVQI